MKTARWHLCNVLYSGPLQRQLWLFRHDGAQVALAEERAAALEEPLPARWVAKGWGEFWQPKLNVAWLPADQVYVHVLEMPPAAPEELPTMVEFQLERLSPLPLSQVVWTYEALPVEEGQPQTVIVVVAARTLVEDYLGGLEGAGYLAQRLETPHLHELLGARERADGAWVHAHQEGQGVVCLVAWWQRKRLRHVGLVTLPLGAETGPQLAEALQRVAWAGEMDGWITGALRCHLVAERSLAVVLEPALRALAAGGIQVSEPLPPPRLAALSAAATTRVNLVPPEAAARYRQVFIDRLWMGGLAALGLVYLVFVAGYFGWLRLLTHQRQEAADRVAALGGSYTNALQLEARRAVFLEQRNLRFAALDCWKGACDALPLELGLSSLTFHRGRRLSLTGTVSSEEQTKVSEYNESLSKTVKEGKPLFSQVNTRSITGQPGRPANWSIDCDVQRVEAE